MSTAEELVKYCSTVHTRTLLPEVLIVDDLEYYLSQLVVSFYMKSFLQMSWRFEDDLEISFNISL